MTAQEILHLNTGQRITSLFVDEISNCLLLGLSDGRIIKANRSTINAYATGNRAISATAEDSYGYISNEAMLKAVYLLQNAILKTDETSSVSSWKTNCPYSANEINEIEGVFTSQPLWAGEDFITWNDIIWDVSNPTNSNTLIQVRSATSQEELNSKSWKTFEATNGQHSESLDSLGTKSPWIQLRSVLKTTNRNNSPFLAKISISYRTKFSVYFYTTKFTMERGADIESGLLVANMEIPKNTEVKIGIIDKNSNDWDGYQIIESEKSFSMNVLNSERVKVGFKLISYSSEAFAKIDEFSFMLGGKKMEVLRAT